MKLRPYQQKAKDAIFSEWQKGNKRTLLVLPTGCG
jgi:superfamily II DNA or RNA helicase